MNSQRQRIGFQYSNPRDNRIRKPVIQNFNQFSSIGEDYYIASDEKIIDMGGEGILDLAKKGLVKIRKIGESASKLYESGVGKELLNLIPDSDETARKGFAGEKHAILKLANGKYGVANYMGPGTNVIARVERNDPPRTLSDKVAQRHDIDYTLAAGMKSKDQQLKAVREADNRMINSLSRLESQKLDDRKNIMLGKQIIKAKTFAEDLGVLDKSKFAGDLEQLDDKDKMKLLSKRASLSMEGYGIGYDLKKKISKALNKKGSGVSIMPSESSGRGLTLAGQRGGFWFLIPFFAWIAEAIAGISAASLASAAATGAASAAGGIIAAKVLGGKGIDNKILAGKIAGKAKEVIDKVKNITVKVTELPKQIVDLAEKALAKIREGGTMDKTKILALAQKVMPHIKKVVDNKTSKIVGQSGNGLRLAGQRGKGLKLAGKGATDKKVMAVLKAQL